MAASFTFAAALRALKIKALRGFADGLLTCIKINI